MRPAIAAIEALLEKPRYFFSMRNPADRLISQLGFLEKNPKLADPPLPEGDVETKIAHLLKVTPYSSYAGCLDTYTAAVEPNRLHVLFYEDLFDAEKAQDVCDGLSAYLGISPRPVPLEKKVNPSNRRGVPDAERQNLVQSLKGEYLSVAARYGERLPASWKSDLALIR